MKVRIQKAGDSLMVVIPEEAAEKVGFTEGMEVEIKEKENGLMIQPSNNTSYFEKLLRNWDGKGAPEGEFEWFDDEGPKGKEEW